MQKEVALHVEAMSLVCRPILQNMMKSTPKKIKKWAGTPNQRRIFFGIWKNE